MPRVNVVKPRGTEQECHFCGEEATVSVEMDPKQRNANQVWFCMCEEHALDLARKLLVTGTSFWRLVDELTRKPREDDDV